MTDFQPNGDKMKRQPLLLSAWRPLNLDQFLLGAAHYPEHVDESYWQRDAERMAECGFNVVRLGEPACFRHPDGFSSNSQIHAACLGGLAHASEGRISPGPLPH
jgi:hypothetical protein